MTARAALLLALAALVPAGLIAEPVRVRSGEHSGFTRLVLDFSGAQDWVFGRVDGGFEFRPGREEVSYRLDRVFDKIGRSRIEEVRDLGDGRLRIGVGCACHASVDALADGKIVLDIATGPARAPGTGVDAVLPAFGAAPQETAQVPAAAPDVPAAPNLSPVRTATVGDRAGLPLTFPRVGPVAPGAPAAADPHLVASADPAATPSPTEGNTAGVPDASGPHPEPAEASAATVARSDRIASTEAALLEQIARAAAQGLLDADMSDLEKSATGPDRQTAAAPASVSPVAPPAPPAPPVTQRGHVTVETSIDRAAAGSAGSGDETNEGDACVDPSLFDVAAWGDGIGTGSDLGAYRSRMITELDAADGAGVTALVRNYIYITFGAEAKALMRRYPDNVERPDLLFAMAEIMDEGRSTAAADLVDQMSCDGATALWATLAQPSLDDGVALNLDAVSIAFGALPAHLRQHLGPRLADRLLAAGHRETAEIVRAAIDRAPGTPGSEYGMLAARFALEDGAVDQATETLDDVVAAGDAVLPEALLHRVEATLGAGGAVAEDVVVLLDGLAFQLRGTETAREMVDAGIRARASAAAFDAAFAQIDTALADGVLSPGRGGALREVVFDRLTRETDDTQFLRLTLPRLAETADLTLPTRRIMAARLLDLGLPEAARAALGSNDAMPEPSDRQLLARAALAERRPAVAIGYLAGLDDSVAATLRAAALEMARDHAGALRAYETTGDREKMVEMAWRGSLWDEAAALDPGAIGAAAQLMTGAPAQQAAATDAGGASETEEIPAADAASDTAPDGSATSTATDPDALPALAQAQTLIDESQASRAALDALLSSLAVPANTPDPAPAPADPGSVAAVPGL